MKEPALDVRFIGATVSIETCKKVERKFRFKEGDSLSVIYARALEDATRGVELTESDYQAIQEEIARNRKKREEKRLKENSRC